MRSTSSTLYPLPLSLYTLRLTLYLLPVTLYSLHFFPPPFYPLPFTLTFAFYLYLYPLHFTIHLCNFHHAPFASHLLPLTLYTLPFTFHLLLGTLCPLPMSFGLVPCTSTFCNHPLTFAFLHVTFNL